MNDRLKFQELYGWHREMLSKLFNASFPGRIELKNQILASHFKIIDNNQSLEIYPPNEIVAGVVKTIPVESHATDADGMEIQALLFTRHGLAYMLEIFRADGGKIIKMPSVKAFKVIVLGK